MKKVIGILLALYLLTFLFGDDQVNWPDIYIDESVAPGGVGSLADPYSDFDEINWTTGGDNSIFDWYAGAEDASVTINLQRGEEWREQLAVGESGSATYPIIIRPYGSGAKPIIMESVTMNGTGNWTAAAENEDWTMNVDASWDGFTDGWFRNLVVADAVGGNGTQIRIRVESHSTVGVPITGASVGEQHGVNLEDFGEAPTRILFDTNPGYVLDPAEEKWSDWVNYTWTDGNAHLIHINVDDVAGNVYRRLVNVGTCYLQRDDGDRTLVQDVTELAADGNIDFLNRIEVRTANTWYSDTTAPDGGDVGNLIMDSEASIGVKIANKVDLDTQGEFWYDSGNTNVWMYSVGNPATVYSGDIECTKLIHNVIVNNEEYITIENLDIRYGAYNGVDISGGSDHIIVQNCDVSYIGGGYFVGTTRSGNGINQWEAGDDIIFRYNNISQVYDYAISTHGGAGPYDKTNQKFYYNIIHNCEAAFEIMVYNENSDLDDIYFENNTCYDSGDVWSHAQRSGGSASIANHIDIIQSDSETGGSVYIRNNIFKDSVEEAVSIGDYYPDIANLVLDYNCYYKASGDMIYYQGDTYTMAQFAAYQAAKGKDASSIATDPLMIDETNIDFRLLMASPCVDAGTDVGLTVDYRGRSIRHAPDIGAYEDPTNVLFLSKLFKYLKETK